MSDRPGTTRGVSWAEFAAEVPELAAFVQARLDAHRHRLMATLRADGSPRISGTELLIHGGELWIGSMPDARKFADLRRDPRLAVHSGSDDPPDWHGDARLTGVAILVDDEPGKAAFKATWAELMGGFPPGPFELARLSITEASTVREAASRDHLVLETWRPGLPVRRIERY
jgi:hypothetical protein